MKKLFLTIALIVLAFSVNAADLSGRITGTIVAADTVTGANVIDSAYTNQIYLPGFAVFQFACQVRPVINGGTPGGNLTDDTIYVWAEHSWDGQTWTAVILDTLFPSANDTISVSTIIPDLSSAVYGPYIRGKFQHNDENEATVVDSFGVVYRWDCRLWINPRE